MNLNLNELTRLLKFIQIPNDDQLDHCWKWIGCIQGAGYGVFRLRGKCQLAHRLTYVWFRREEIPPKMEIDHLCRSRWCVNPYHLEIVTGAENNRRGVSVASLNSRKTHCPKGHPYSGDNLVVDKDGRRCKVCRQAQSRISARDAWRRKHWGENWSKLKGILQPVSPTQGGTNG